MSEPTKTADAAGMRRVVRIVNALAGHEVDGVSNAQLAESLRCTPSACLRTLQVLADEGWVEQFPETKRWRLGPRPVQVALAFTQGLDRAESRVAEVRQRFSRLPT